jgi:hypothetical protein
LGSAMPHNLYDGQQVTRWGTIVRPRGGVDADEE